jgi:hypothetical protein
VADEKRETVEALERRVALLEAAIRALATDLEKLQTRPATSDGAAAPAASGISPTPQKAVSSPSLLPANWLPQQLDFESLIGRYGTLVLATVSALAAVGLFLGWAIDKGLLGPTQRIGLGLLAAAALGVAGLRLRRRERSFGASLLGLALAITHVCAWGAGPSLQLVPPWGAFLLAAAASIALAIFAHAEEDEPLWSVGFSGAAVAPFVTASGRADLLLLSAYGVAVLASAGYAMGTRRWMIAGRLFLLAALIYTAALATGFEADRGPLLAMAFPLAVVIAGVVPWIDGWRRRERVRALGALAALAALRSAMGMNLPYEPVVVAQLIAGAGLAWLVLVDRTHSVAEPPEPTTQRRLYEGDWLDAAVLPLGFVLAMSMALDASERGTGLAMAAASAVLMIPVMRLSTGSLRDAAVFATVLSALISVLLLLRGRPLEITGAIAILSTVCFAANVLWRSASWSTLGLIGFAWSAIAAVGQLTARPMYQFTPFGTRESALAAVLLLAIIVAWRCVTREPKLETVLRGAVIGWAFLWIHQELAFAFNPTAATLLRVTYYAATSAAAVGIGRARAVPILRHLGLGLAVLAAGTALYGAKDLPSIGAKIGADLVAAVFLLAIAYWYRKPGGTSGIARSELSTEH